MQLTRLSLLALGLLVTVTASSQTMVGKWKRVANSLEMSDGTKKDMQALLLKSMPCMADIVYVFSADGAQYSQSPAGCGLGDSQGKAHWKVQGNLIILVPDDASLAGFISTYTLAFHGNTASMTHVYSAQEKARLHTKASKIIITYQRV